MGSPISQITPPTKKPSSSSTTTTNQNKKSDYKQAVKSAYSTNPFLYVKVLKNNQKGFWEINIDTKTALFREKGHKLQNKQDGIHDWTEVHKTIMDFLKDTFKVKHVKEIINDIKYVYSDNDIFCSWAIQGNVAHNPNQEIHCTKKAMVWREGKPLCTEHTNINF